MDMFEPGLSLVREPDGEHTLHAVTLTPNSCYSAGTVTSGVPEGQTVIPEAIPVILEILHINGFCLQVITPVRHALADLRLGGESGKTSVVAFVMLTDLASGSRTLVGQSSVSLDDEDRITVVPEEQRGRAASDEWSATANLKEPPPYSLFVRGRVLAPTPGYKVTLTPAVPQGINPTELILDLALTPPGRLVPAVLTWTEARYDDADYAAGHDTVAINFGAGTMTVIPIHKVM